MIRSRVLIGVFSAFLQAIVAFSTPLSQIRYTTTDLGSGRWQYDYEVTNIGLGQILEEFTIWFDFELYDNLSREPLYLPWQATVWQPEPVLEEDGGYNCVNRAWGDGIAEGETLGGFAVSFDWLGTGMPGSQSYEIIDLTTSEVFNSGYTVPEPATLSLLALGAVLLRKKK